MPTIDEQIAQSLRDGLLSGELQQHLALRLEKLRTSASL